MDPPPGPSIYTTAAALHRKVAGVAARIVPKTAVSFLMHQDPESVFYVHAGTAVLPLLFGVP